MHNRRLFPALAALLGAAACSSEPHSDTLAPDLAFTRHPQAGAVIVASNAADGNALLVFPRDAEGTLGQPASFATGGRGTGAGLGNQGGITRAGHFLLVVNAGSNDVSVFRQGESELTLVDRVASGGERPLSVTANGPLVYVLNAGGHGNIAGFLLRGDGKLRPLPGSIRPLSADAPDPAQIAFTPDGRQLVVTEKGTNRITTYDLGFEHRPGHPVPHPSAGQTPFGFGFDLRGHLLVSEAFGGATDASALSSYALGRLGGFRVISPSVGTTETSACWVAVTPDGRYAYVANTGSASVTGYRIAANGTLARLSADGVSGQTGQTPNDLTTAAGGSRLYVLNNGAHTISGFVVGSDGSLESLALNAVVPVGANGMVAW